MTDESAKILAAAIERLANAVSFGIHVHVHQQGGGVGPIYPSWPPPNYPIYPYTTWCSTNGVGGAGGLPSGGSYEVGSGGPIPRDGMDYAGVGGSAIPGGR